MIPIYNTWCICVMHDIQIVLMWTTSNFALHYSYKYYIIIHIYIIILYHFVYIISANTKTSLPLHNLDSKIIVWRWSQIEALLVTNRAGSQIEALCGHKSCRSHKLKRVTNRAVTPVHRILQIARKIVLPSFSNRFYKQAVRDESLTFFVASMCTD